MSSAEPLMFQQAAAVVARSSLSLPGILVMCVAPLVVVVVVVAAGVNGVVNTHSVTFAESNEVGRSAK